MKPIEIQGDILMCRTQVLAHQVNCRGVMGAGLAKQIADTYPRILRSYKIYCERSNPLGTCLLTPTRNGPIIANLFGQENYSIIDRMTDYRALERALCDLVIKMKINRLYTVSIPYGIGCGLGGGEWCIINNIINRIFMDTNIRVEIWKLDNN